MRGNAHVRFGGAGQGNRPPETEHCALARPLLERLHREVKRRTDVVGVFPNDAAIDRLVTAVIVEQHDEWAVAERRYLSETSTARLRQDQGCSPVPAGH